MLSDEPLDAVAIAKDNHCEVGKWLRGEAREVHGQRASYGRCFKSHAAFHVEAGRVAAAINAHRKDEAEKMLAPDSRFSQASKDVSLALVELKNEIG